MRNCDTKKLNLSGHLFSAKIVTREKEQNKAFPWFVQGYKVAMDVGFEKQDCQTLFLND